MESFRSAQSNASLQCEAAAPSPNISRGTHLEYSDSVYVMPSGQNNTIMSEAPAQAIAYAGTIQDGFVSNLYLRRNSSVPVLFTPRRRGLRRNENNRNNEPLSAGRYRVPARQLSVPTLSNFALNDRTSEILRIHQGVVDHHNSLQSRLRNATRFIYQSEAGNGPSGSPTSPGHRVLPIQVIGASNGGIVSGGNNLRVVTNFFTGRRRSSSINTRNFSRNVSNVPVHPNQIMSIPTQSINLAEPVEVKLPMRVIESFPINRFSNEDSGLEGASNSCSVCLEDYRKGDEVRRLPCTHFYHKTCIDLWLQRSTICPICKFDYIVMLQL